MEKILIIQTRPGIGDMCVFLTYVHKIAETYPNKEIIILTKSRSRADELLRDDILVKDVIYVPKKNIKDQFNFIKKLKKFNFSASYIFHYGFRYYFLSKILNIENIFFYGFFKKNESIVDKAKYSTEKWLQKSNLEFNPKLYLNKKIQKNNSIILGIGGSGNTKKWPIENYIDLVAQITNKHKFNYILAGGPNEKKDAEIIIKKLENLNLEIKSICDLKLYESLKVISGSYIYIGNDTGFMHVSGLLGIKSFGLFGDTPTNYSDYNKLIFPIKPSGLDNVGHDSFAMKLITVEQVHKVIDDFMRKDGRVV